MSDDNNSAPATGPKKPGIVFRGSMVPLCAAAGAPLYPAQLPLPAIAPEGTRWIHAAASPAEADYLRQILAQAGFHPPYVPPAITGVVGAVGTIHLYLPEEEAEEGSQFLREFLENPEGTSDEPTSAEIYE